MSKYYLSYNEVNGKRFKYFDVGYETHGANTYRVWVNNRVETKVDEDGREYIEFPLVGVGIKQGKKKKTLILYPNENLVVVDYFIKCGYRGGSEFSVTNASVLKNYDKFEYLIYASERGSLGISEGALIVFNKTQKAHIKWERWGRLYGGAPEGECLLGANGEECVIGDLEELENELD